jgi:DNA-binding transcriptional LysR family regulator
VHRDEVPDALNDGELDLAFTWGPLAGEGVVQRTLTAQPRVLLLNDANAFATRNELTAEDLVLIPLIQSDSADPAFLAWAVLDPRPDGSRARVGGRGAQSAGSAGHGGHRHGWLPRSRGRRGRSASPTRDQQPEVAGAFSAPG